MTKKQFAESDMYAPIKDFFAQMGYDVKGEVKGCDITMVKDGELLIVEMKKTFNMSLLFQLMERQTITAQVYAAIPNPRRLKGGGDFGKIKKVCEKMGVGLITVDVDSGLKRIDIAAFPPVPDAPERGKRKQRLKGEILTEMGGRTFDLNTGGVTKKKLVTAYREKAIAAACALKKAGTEISAPELTRDFGAPDKCYSIFRSNYYGWFEQTGKGRFKLSAKGEEALCDAGYRDLIDYYMKGGERDGGN